MVGRTTSYIWRRRSTAFLATFALSLLAFVGPGYSAPTNVHGAVYTWSEAHPGEDIPVVIRSSNNSAVAAEITASGGDVEQQLDLVSSVQARVSRDDLNEVASLKGVSWVSLDAPLVFAGPVVDYSAIVTSYPFAVNANDVWAKGYAGAGVGVAVIDTGISPSGHEDFKDPLGVSRVIAEVEFNPATSNVTDGYGHGTHVAGIIAGDGSADDGKYVGIAPGANLINVKIADETGASSLGDLIAGLQWVNENKAAYNIRVVNLSLHSSVAESYKTSVLDAAVEALWFNGIFVVVASGNTGSAADAVSYPPANDPFVMTVGAVDDKGTKPFGDDVPATWSSNGVTQDGFTKPEMLTPGVNIVSVAETNSILYKENPAKVVDDEYLRLSGTSMAAAVMSGVAALELEKHPDWKPGELKCTLIAKARKLSPPYAQYLLPRAGDTFNETLPSGNCDTGIRPSYFLNAFPIVAFVGSVSWVLDQPNVQAAAGFVGIDLAAANIVTDPALIAACAPAPTATTTVNLCNVDWSVIKWDAITWDAIKWDAIKWSAIKWDVIKWDPIKWDAIKWDAIKWDAIKWDAIKWDAIKWSSIKWSAVTVDSLKWTSVQTTVVEGAN